MSKERPCLRKEAYLNRTAANISICKMAVPSLSFSYKPLINGIGAVK
jgi:hypothetical protein